MTMGSSFTDQDRETLAAIAADVKHIRDTIDELQRQAVEMVSPENIMKMFTGFMGGGSGDMMKALGL